MAKNIPGAIFVSKGVKYVLDYGPKGNLRPYTLGVAKTVIKTRNPYVIGVAILLAAAIGYWAWKNHNARKAV
jgi:hypothetical protein